MNRLAKLIQKMPYKDLILLQKDLKAGNIEYLVKKRLEAMSPTRARICPVCNAEIKDDNYTIIFGPSDFRQKASFDGPDCLKYFLDKLEREKNEKKNL